MKSFAVIFLCVLAGLVQTSIIHGTEVISSPALGPNPELAFVPSGSPGYRNAADLGYTNRLQEIPGVFNNAVGAFTNGVNGVSGTFTNTGVTGVNPFVGTREGNVAVAGELPVAGKTALIGQLPISGAVKFGGKLPATAALSVNARCTCLC